MSDQENPEELEVTPAKESSERVEEKIDLAFGYSIGVKIDGSLFFQLHGEEKGAVQLLGLNSLAKKQIEALVDQNLGLGHSQVVNILGEIFRKIQQLENSPKPNEKE